MTNMKRIVLVGMAACWLTQVQAAEKPASPAPETASPDPKVQVKAADLFPDRVLAKGKGFEVKRSQVDEAFIAYKGNMAARGQPVPEDQRAMIESKLLDRLIITQILMGKANAADKAKAKETSDKILADAMKRFPTEEAFN